MEFNILGEEYTIELNDSNSLLSSHHGARGGLLGVLSIGICR